MKKEVLAKVLKMAGTAAILKIAEILSVDKKENKGKSHIGYK